MLKSVLHCSKWNFIFYVKCLKYNLSDQCLSRRGRWRITVNLDFRAFSKAPTAKRAHRKSTRAEKSSTPGQVVIAEGQVPITLSGDLEDGIGNGRLYRGASVVRHAIQPMACLEETDVDFGRVLVDARQHECVKVVLRNASLRDVALLIHRVVVEPHDLTFDLFSNT